MPSYPCPVCGDPRGFPIWIDDTPPEGCPHDESWHDGARMVNNVSECSYQRQKAEQMAAFRKLVPDAFDELGNILPGGLARCLHAYADAYPGKDIVL